MLEGKRSKFELFPNRRWPSIPKVRFYWGVIIGLCFSFSCYAFLNLNREVCRYFSITRDYDMWILSVHNHYWMNFLFSLLSLLWGQAICMQIWFQRPQSIVGFKRFNVNSLINDIRVLVLYFFFWLFSMGLLVFYCQSIDGWYLPTGLSSLINIIFSLVSAVLFLQYWTYIRLKFGIEGLKYQAIFLSVIIGLSFVFARVDFYDHKKLENRILSKNVLHNYELEFPTTNTPKRTYVRTSKKGIYLAWSGSENKRKVPIYIYDGIEISPNKLLNTLATESGDSNYRERMLIYQKVGIDKNMPIAWVNHLFKMLELNHRYLIAIHVSSNPKEQQHSIEDNYFELHSILMRKDSIIQNIYNTHFRDKEGFRIIQKKEGSFELENQEFSLTELETALKFDNMKKGVQNIEFVVHPNAPFYSYFDFVQMVKRVIKIAYNRKAFELFHEEYDYCQVQEKKKVRELSGVQLLVITQDQISLLKG